MKPHMAVPRPHLRVGFVFLAVLIGLLVAAALPARAQELADLPLPAGWGECVVRGLSAALALVFAIELLRWRVPGWERESGVRLPPSARNILFVLVLGGGQLGAWLQWPDPFVRTPWPGEYWPATGAGLVVSAFALLFNELIWKHIARLAQDRFGVAPRRVKDRRAVVSPPPPAA